jgi:hypothetical protein
MAANVEQSQLLGDMHRRSKGAFGRSKKKEVRPRGQGLPAGIRNGIAKLTSYKVGKSDKGVPYFTITGSTCVPEEFNGVRCSSSYRFEDTDRKTVEQVNDEFTGDVRLICGPNCLDEVEDIRGIPKVLDKAIKDGTYFNFNTGAWSFGGNSGVKTYIQGACDPPDGVDDPAPDAPADDEPVADADEANDTTADDEPPADDESATDAGDWEPGEGEIYGYKVNPRAKIENFEVVKVDKKNTKVNLKREKDGKEFKGVLWSSLENSV